MNIPAKLIIEGEPWTVNLIDSTDHALDTRLFGSESQTTREISLDALHRTSQTFLHELIHIIDKNHALGLEEAKIMTLAQVLYAIIVDNKLDFRREESLKDE